MACLMYRGQLVRGVSHFLITMRRRAGPVRIPGSIQARRRILFASTGNKLNARAPVV